MTLGRRAAARAAGSAILAALCAAGPAAEMARAAGALARLADPGANDLLARLGRRDVHAEDLTSADGRARLFAPAGSRSPAGVVLVHGVHRLGIDEPRLVRFARAIAGAGVAVLTPEVTELAAFAIEPRSIETLGAACATLGDRLAAAAVGLVGISFAGGLSIVAAADARFAPRVGFVASVGGHHDLATVLDFFASDPRAHDYGPLILVYGELGRFFAPEDVPAAREALRAWLWEREADARAHLPRLSAPGRARMELLFAHRVRELGPLLGAAARAAAERAPAVSPAGHLARLRAPLFVLHGDVDAVIPPSEAHALARGCPPALLRQVLVTPAITHAELDRRVTVADRVALVRFFERLLAAAETARVGLPV